MTSRFNHVTDVYAKALATGLVQRDVEQIVPLVLARAGYEKRQLETGGAVEEIFLSMIEIVEGGIKMVHQCGYRRRYVF